MGHIQSGDRGSSTMASILRVAPFLYPRVARLARFPRGLPSRFPTRRVFAASRFSSTAPSSVSPPPPPPPETLPSDPRSEAPASAPLQWVSRTAFCGDLGVEDVGRRVRLCGWVALHRVHGGLTFFNIRDSSGIVQVRSFLPVLVIYLSFLRLLPFL